MIIDLVGRIEVAAMPGGEAGVISFDRFVDQFRKAGEIRGNETITHLKINLRAGTIEYRVEPKAGAR
jgi:hypothetical protein